jgi:hypothetical protein
VIDDGGCGVAGLPARKRPCRAHRPTGAMRALWGSGLLMSKNPAWLEKLNQYVKDAVVIHEIDLKGSVTFNKFIKWWLEQIRNLLAVSAFYFLAQKSDSIVLKSLATISWLVFFSYFTTWQNTFSVRFFPYIKHKKLNLLVNFSLWLAIVMPIWWVVIVGLAKAFDELTKITAR